MPEGAALAPMAGVTDASMRLLCAEMGCAWAVSEMLSAKGYLYSPESRAHQELLEKFDGEGILGLQLFGSDPDMISEAAKRLEDRPFAFFDFNIGCPAHKIVGNGEGSALMRKPELVGRIVNAFSKAVKKPVTVKIRAGWDEKNINAVEIAKICEDNGACAITVHPRTREQFYTGKSDWTVIRDVKQAVHIPVIGNGDITCWEDARKMLSETGCDGIMVARAAEGNPWIFREILCGLRGEKFTPPTVEDRVKMAIRHLDMHIRWRGEKYAVPEMRKHVAWYLQGTPMSGKLRAKVNTMLTHEEVKNALDEYLDAYKERME
ncbi:MAG: tRNA dihydrouridine synthase DusB [Clostridia bacterium]|nr:tRNA dihydrouridine synthase DusB [Clostridia bacterium]MBQ5771378.1 tRNA dihydrouridine synthase DusB [Clostridia bacterium]